MNKKTLFCLILLMSLTFSTALYFITPTKADAYTFAINWEKLYTEQTYDGGAKGEFRLQVKYYANGAWRMQETSKFDVEPGDLEKILYPDIYFILDYDLEHLDDLAFRIIEDDPFSDDQIIKPMEYDTGSGINDGGWHCWYLLYNPSTWYSRTYGEENSSGDWFEVRIINLDY